MSWSRPGPIPDPTTVTAIVMKKVWFLRVLNGESFEWFDEIVHPRAVFWLFVPGRDEPAHHFERLPTWKSQFKDMWDEPGIKVCVMFQRVIWRMMKNK